MQSVVAAIAWLTGNGAFFAPLLASWLFQATVLARARAGSIPCRGHRVGQRHAACDRRGPPPARLVDPAAGGVMAAVTGKVDVTSLPADHWLLADGDWADDRRIRLDPDPAKGGHVTVFRLSSLR